MRIFRTTWISTALAAVLGCGFEYGDGEILQDEVFFLGAMTLPGFGDLAETSDLEQITLRIPFEEKDFMRKHLSGALRAYPQRISFRSSIHDETKNSMTTPSTYTTCVDNQASLAWIEALEFRIQLAGQPETGVAVGRYERPKEGASLSCAIELTTKPDLNLTDFFPTYDVVIQVTGEAPLESTPLVGIMELATGVGGPF